MERRYKYKLIENIVRREIGIVTITMVRVSHSPPYCRLYCRLYYLYHHSTAPFYTLSPTSTAPFYTLSSTSTAASTALYGHSTISTAPYGHSTARSLLPTSTAPFCTLRPLSYLYGHLCTPRRLQNAAEEEKATLQARLEEAKAEAGAQASVLRAKMYEFPLQPAVKLTWTRCCLLRLLSRLTICGVHVVKGCPGKLSSSCVTCAFFFTSFPPLHATAAHY